MNKKLVILSIAIPLVLVLVIGIIAASIALKDRKIDVTGVKITNPEFNNEKRLYEVNIDEVNSFQLTWNVTPENAENKEVTFSSTDANFVVDASGNVTFTKPWVGTTIIIKTVDGGYTDQVSLSTYTEQVQEVNYNFETNSVTASSDNSYTMDGQTLVLFKNTNYSFGEYLLKLNNKEYPEGSFRADDLGDFVISISNGSETKTINAKIVERVTTLALPDYLVQLKDNNNQAVDTLKVGNKNEYKFNYVTNSINNTNPIEFSFYNKSTNLLDEDGITYSGNAIQFGNNVGKTYKVVASAKYNPNVKIEFNFEVCDGYNAENDSELKTVFNNDSINKIYVVRPITATLPNDLVDKDGYAVKNSDRGIYERLNSVYVYGNYFTIDASSAPYTKIEYNAETNYPDFGHDLTSVFRLGNTAKEQEGFFVTPEIYGKVDGNTPLSAEEKTQQKNYVVGLYDTAQEFVFDSLNVKANGGKGITTVDNGNTVYAGYSALTGFTVNDIKLTLKNCNISRTTNGIKTTYGLYELNIENCNISDNAGYDVYIRRTAKTILKDSTFGECGHAAIYAKSYGSSCLIDEYTEVTEFNTDGNNTFYNDGKEHTGTIIKFVGNVVFDNWTDGKDPFLAYNDDGTATIPTQLKQIVYRGLGSEGVYMVLKDVMTNGQINLDNAKFNWGFMAESFSSNKKDECKFEIDFSEVNGKSPNYSKDAYWRGLYAGMTGDYTTAKAEMAKIFVNGNIVEFSINAGLALPGNGWINGMSYVYVGPVNQ